MVSDRDGMFYGGPSSYYGTHLASRVQPPRPDWAPARSNPPAR